MSFATDASQRLTAAKNLDAALAAVGTTFTAYQQAVAATVASASELTNCDLRTAKERLSDHKADLEIVASIGHLLPHYVTAPGPSRSQAEVDQALLNELMPGVVG
jgi:hypothetical protein